MKLIAIIKNIFISIAATALFGGWICFFAVWIFQANTNTLIWMEIIIFLIFLAFFLSNDYDKVKFEQECQEYEEKQQLMKEEKQRTIDMLQSKYGRCSYCMAHYKRPYDTDLVRIYPEARVMVIKGNEYRFDEIVTCSISHRDINDTVEEKHTVESTDNAHIARRIAAGAMIGGLKGAALAAVTTRPRTITTTDYTYSPIVRTKYTVVITTTRNSQGESIYMDEDFNRAHRLMKQINAARIQIP